MSSGLESGEGGQKPEVGHRKASEESPERRKKSLTVEEAADRIAALGRVYDRGYLSWGLYESMKHEIEARVRRRRRRG